MTITVVAAPGNYDEGVPQVPLTVSSSPALTAPITLIRIHEDGTEWPLLTEDAPQLVGGTWVGFDYHPPLEQDVTYRATAASQTGTSAATSVPAAGSRLWLISPTDPLMSVMATGDWPGDGARVVGFEAPIRASAAVKSRILGSAYAVHQNDSPRQAPTGSVTISCDTPESVAAMQALLDDGGPLLLNTNWGSDWTWLWIQPGDTGPALPVANFRKYPSRRFVIPFEATMQPDVDLTALWTFDDITALGLTFTQLAAQYATFNDMTLDIRTG